MYPPSQQDTCDITIEYIAHDELKVARFRLKDKRKVYTRIADERR